MDGSGGTADHADRVHAVHARVGDHVMIMLNTVANEAWIIVVRASASTNAVVAPCASVLIDDHRGGTVDVAVFDQEFDQFNLHLPGITIHLRACDIDRGLLHHAG